ncbi:MAG: hypothetical protein U1C19_04765 [Methanobacteriaceae archaeon]|nr:hypothetical protein [Methanobacteriaceae archaeon]
MTKDRVTITVDGDAWALFGTKFSNKSKMIDSFIKKAIDWTDKEQECLDRIKKLQSELDHEKDNLCRIRELKKQRSVETGGYDKALEVLSRMNSVHGMVGKNTIKTMAQDRGLNFDVLLSKCVKEGFNIVNFWQVHKDTKTRW